MIYSLEVKSSKFLEQSYLINIKFPKTQRNIFERIYFECYGQLLENLIILLVPKIIDIKHVVFKF